MILIFYIILIIYLKCFLHLIMIHFQRAGRAGHRHPERGVARSRTGVPVPPAAAARVADAGRTGVVPGRAGDAFTGVTGLDGVTGPGLALADPRTGA
jgi:hypothetical protein